MKRIIAGLLITFILILGSGCDTYSVFDHYPYDKADRWVCEDPPFEIHYEYEDGHLVSQTYQIEWDGELLPVQVGFMYDNYAIMLDNGDNSVDFDEMLVSGTWFYRGEYLVLTINSDNLFDGAYTELVLVPQNS